MRLPLFLGLALLAGCRIQNPEPIKNQFKTIGNDCKCNHRNDDLIAQVWVSKHWIYVFTDEGTISRTLNFKKWEIAKWE